MIETESARHGHTIAGDRGLFAQCPDCDSRDFLIDDVGSVLFACLGCDSRWRYSLGYVWRVEDRTLSKQTDES